MSERGKEEIYRVVREIRLVSNPSKCGQMGTLDWTGMCERDGDETRWETTSYVGGGGV